VPQNSLYHTDLNPCSFEFHMSRDPSTTPVLTLMQRGIHFWNILLERNFCSLEGKVCRIWLTKVFSSPSRWHQVMQDAQCTRKVGWYTSPLKVIWVVLGTVWLTGPYIAPHRILHTSFYYAVVKQVDYMWPMFCPPKISCGLCDVTLTSPIYWEVVASAKAEIP